MSVLQTVQKKQQTIYIWTGSAKKKLNKKILHWSIYSAPDSAKKQQQQFTYGQTVQKNNKQFTYGQTVQKKLHWSIYSAPDSAKKQQQFTYGQYIFTDCTEDNVKNTHTYVYENVYEMYLKIYIFLFCTYRLKQNLVDGCRWVATHT